MILTRLAAIVAVLLALAVPCIRGRLMVRDARRRAGSPAPGRRSGDIMNASPCMALRPPTGPGAARR
jgi:hypothetical protein